MGHRVLRRDAIPPLLADLVAIAARTLPRGGRLVWLSPAGEATAEAARRAGLKLVRRLSVDLGGIAAELQRMEA
jgi:hypothetical protein